MRITRQDFGYDAMRWHDYLWDTDAGAYRWARRSRDKWARQIQVAISNPEVERGITEMAGVAAALGYNERMDEEIRARFGSDVVAATWREVERKVKKHGAGYTGRPQRGAAPDPARDRGR